MPQIAFALRPHYFAAESARIVVSTARGRASTTPASG